MSRKTLKEAIMDAWDALIPLAGLNMIWFLFTALVITAFPAFGGLYYATNQITHGESAGLGTFFEGFKEQFWISWKWGLVTLIVYGLSFVNIWFYGQFEGLGYLLLQSFFLSALLVFTCINIYTYPFLLEQEKPSIKLALKNSFAAFVRYMGRTLLLVLFSIALAIVSVLLPPLWILCTMSVITYFANWQALVIIHDISEKVGENR